MQIYKILTISDIHSNLNLIKPLKYKDADFLLVAGDLTNIGLKVELQAMLDSINNLDNIKHKIVVLGNHDSRNLHNTRGMSDEIAYAWCKRHYPNIHFLNNEIVEIDGLKIYGSPYVSEFCGWGFQYNLSNRDELTIPKENVDIIVCHEPPSSIELSYIEGVGDLGNRKLREYLEDNKCKMLVCGHIHENKGKYLDINGCQSYNVAGKLTELYLER